MNSLDKYNQILEDEQYKLEQKVIQYFKTNHENGISTMAHVFDVKKTKIHSIVNKYIKSIIK